MTKSHEPVTAVESGCFWFCAGEDWDPITGRLKTGKKKKNNNHKGDYQIVKTNSAQVDTDSDTDMKYCDELASSEGQWNYKITTFQSIW